MKIEVKIEEDEEKENIKIDNKDYNDNVPASSPAHIDAMLRGEIHSIAFGLDSIDGVELKEKGKTDEGINIISFSVDNKEKIKEEIKEGLRILKEPSKYRLERLEYIEERVEEQLKESNKSDDDKCLDISFKFGD